MTDEDSPADEAFRGRHARAYAEGPPRQVPGFEGLHRMASLLLAERVPERGRVLVLGAGGGLELRNLAADHPGWRFDGVDPSAAMLRTAEAVAAAHLDRIALHCGFIGSAPEGPFDGAICLLTLHFVAQDQRLETLREIRRRLRPGAPFVAAHFSFAQTEPERSLWLARHSAFSGADAVQARRFKEAAEARLSILAPEADEALLRAAGFSEVALFYAGFGLRGWVCAAA